MRTVAIAVIVVTASSCMSLYGGAWQRVTVTSTPPGAQVFLDGEPTGTTPTTVTVRRGSDPGPVIDVQKGGYPAFRRRLERSSSLERTLGSIGIGAGIGLFVSSVTAVSREGGPSVFGWLIGGIVGPLSDWGAGVLYKFPDRVDARLGEPPPGWLTDPERRRRERERWLRRPIGLRSAVGLEPPARQSVGPVQPRRHVALRDAKPAGDLGGRSVLDVPCVPPIRPRSSGVRGNQGRLKGGGRNGALTPSISTGIGWSAARLGTGEPREPR